MRKPDLAASVTINGNPYTMESFLREFVWSQAYWSADEATVAAFDRLTAKPGEQDEKDFERVCTVLRGLTFNGPQAFCAIELSHLRNIFVLTPKE